MEVRWVPQQSARKTTGSLCGWVIPKCSSLLSAFIFYLDEKCADFHSVSGQIELWHIVHDFHNWFHILLLPAAPRFWQLPIGLSSLRGMVGHLRPPHRALDATVTGAFASIWHRGSHRCASCPGHMKGKWWSRFGPRSIWGSALTKCSSICQVFPAWIPSIPRHLNQ